MSPTEAAELKTKKTKKPQQNSVMIAQGRKWTGLLNSLQ